MNETTQINLTRMPGAVDALHHVSRFFKETQHKQPDQMIELDPHERTADGMIELGWEHLQLQRDLHLEYTIYMGELDRPSLEAKVASQFVAMNAEREASGNPPIDISEVNTDFLKKILGEPNWLGVSAEELSGQPDYIQEMTEELRQVDAKLGVLSQDDEIRRAAHEKYQAKMEITRTAYGLLRAETKRDETAKQISEIYARAVRTDRRLNTADKKRLARLEAHLAASDESGSLIVGTDPSQIEALATEVNRLIRRDNHRQLEQGLLLTPGMKETVDKVLPLLMGGHPVLFIGETGGAKTQLAKVISERFMEKEPEIISFHGEIDVYDLMGKLGLNTEGTTFVDGPLTRAMQEGRPVIFDEINAAPPEFMKRLNEILLLRPYPPNNRIKIQEDSGKEVVVQPGFCIISTANYNDLQPGRYGGTHKFSAELRNRFGKEVRINYPDSDVVFGALPPDNMALAEAALVDEIGEYAVDLPDGQLVAFVRAAHASQRIFCGDYGDGRAADNLRAFAPQDRVRDNRPGLKDNVISPRRMVMILEAVRSRVGSPDPLVEELREWIEAIEDKTDQAVLTNLLNSYQDNRKVSLLGNHPGDG